MIDRDAIYQQVIARLDSLNLPMPLDEQSFCAAVERLTGRPVRVRAVPMAAVARWLGHPPDKAPLGVWLTDEVTEVDYLLYEARVSRAHRLVILFHEGAHIIWGDRTLRVSLDQLAPWLFPDLDLTRVRAYLGRDEHATFEETRAELTATELEIRSATARTPARRPAPLSPAAAAAQRQLLVDFGSGEQQGGTR
jgi:hypothetical protein